MEADLPLKSTAMPESDSAAVPKKQLIDTKDDLAQRISTKAAADQLDINKNWFQHKHGCGNALNGSAYEHDHSISSTVFVKRDEWERLAMLADRTNLLKLLGSRWMPRPLRVLAKNLENVLALLMDYVELDAWERERRFSDPEWAGWTEAYKQCYGMDEYREENHDFYMVRNGVKQHIHRGITK